MRILLTQIKPAESPNIKYDFKQRFIIRGKDTILQNDLLQFFVTRHVYKNLSFGSMRIATLVMIDLL